MLLNSLPLNLLPPKAVLLADDVALLSLPADEAARRGLLAAKTPPFGTVEVQSKTGPHRIAALRSADIAEPPSPDDGLDPIAPVVLGSDIVDLADELDPPSRRRLLAFLLGFCRKAFALGRDPDFASACLRLARICLPDGGPVEPVASVGKSWTILSGLRAPTELSLFAISHDRVERRTLHAIPGLDRLSIAEPVAPGQVLLAIGRRPALWTVSATAATSLPDFLRPQRERSRLQAACLKALAPVCPVVSASLRERTFLTPAAPLRHEDARRPVGAALDVAFSDGEGGIFLRGWLRDPMDLVASIELRGPAGAVPLEAAQLHRFRRRDVDAQFAKPIFAEPDARLGFVAHVTDPLDGLALQPTLTVRLRSGATLDARPGPHLPDPATARSAVLTSVPPDEVTDAMLDGCLGPAAAAFHRRALSRRGAAETVRIGQPTTKPAVTLVVPLYRNLGFLRFQVAALAADPDCRDAELVYVLDSPEQRAETEHLLRGLHAMHDLPMTLVVMPRNLGYAAACNEGARLARAPALLLLNSDVVPGRARWLGALRAALWQPGVGAAGPKLLFDDDSIQHAGLYFDRGADGTWFNAHYHKGMPRHWPAAGERRLVPGLTGAALLVHRWLFEDVGGICEDYVVGDYEDSDFCLRLRAAGWSTMYVPAAELYHFERRSIGLHSGYAGTLACRYNRRLHHRRWDTDIAALMAASGAAP